MKNNFTAPELKIELFISEDVITTSGTAPATVTAVDNVRSQMTSGGAVDPSNIKIVDFLSM